MSLWRWSGGVHVLGTRIWCDAARAHGVSFVSGADIALRGRPFGKEGRILTTPRTQKLVGDRFVGLPAPFGRPFALGRARLELLPAGRLPGSAQLRVEIDGQALLYAGAVHPLGGRLAEPPQVRGCDELVLELAAPPVDAQLLESARQGSVAVGSLFRAAEAAALLAEAGLPVQTSRPLATLLSRYRRMGIAVPKLVKEGVQISWPAPQTVDLAALAEFAASTGAKVVHVVGGFSDEAASAFAKKKLRASPLGPPQQVPLFS